MSFYTTVNEQDIRVWIPGEERWKQRYFDEVKLMTQRCEEINREAEAITYRANTEEELREKQNERLKDGWTKI